MQLTISSDEKLDTVLSAVGGLFNVHLVVAGSDGNSGEAEQTQPRQTQSRPPGRPRRGRGGDSAGRPRRRGAGEPDTSAVRAWARENGFQVSDRGRIPSSVISAYASSNG